MSANSATDLWLNYKNKIQNITRTTNKGPILKLALRVRGGIEYIFQYILRMFQEFEGES